MSSAENGRATNRGSGVPEPGGPAAQPAESVPRTVRPAPAPDDTAAFQRFYLAEPDEASHGWLYKLLVGWWRKPTGSKGS